MEEQAGRYLDLALLWLHYKDRLLQFTWYLGVLITAGIWVVFIFFVGRYFAEGPQFNAMYRAYTASSSWQGTVHALLIKAQPAPILLYSVASVPGEHGYQTVALVRNPNAIWEAQAVLDWGQGRAEAINVYPGQEKVVIDSTPHGAQAPQGVQLGTTQWSKQPEHARAQSATTQYVRCAQGAFAQGTDILPARLPCDLSNSSSFFFKDVSVTTFALSDTNSIVAVSHLVVSRLDPGQTVSIEARFSQSALASSRVTHFTFYFDPLLE